VGDNEEEPRKKPDPSDEVLAIIVYKNDPHCTEYAFEVRSEYKFDDPLHLEQLMVTNNLLNKYIEASREAVLGNALKASREVRRANKEYFDKFEVTPKEVN
jgi:hypothetical protein